MKLSILQLVIVIFDVVSQVLTARECRPVDRCSCQWTDTNAIVSLWGIDNPNDILFKDVPRMSSPLYVDYNPCTSFTEGACHEDLVCQHDKERNKTSFVSLGKANKMSVEVITENNNTLIFLYQGGSQGGLEKTTAITLKCDKLAKKPTITNPREGPEAGYYSFDLTTHCACDGVCYIKTADDNTKGGLSFGSILCVLLVVLLFVYFISGFLFLKYYKHHEGTDTIPQYEFWKDLPAKVKDGFAFTISSVTGDKGEYQSI